MRRWTLANFRWTNLLALAVSLFLTEQAGASTVVTVNYAGTLDTVSSLMEQLQPGVQPGDRILGTFSYDYSQTGSSGGYTFTGSSKVHALSFAIYPATGPENSSTQLFADRYTGNSSLQSSGYYHAQVTYHSSGTTLDLTGDTVYKSAQTVLVNGNLEPDNYYWTGIPAFDLQLTNPTNAPAYTATNLPLPTTTIMSNFATTAGTLAWDPNGVSFTATLPTIIVLPSGVPEPSGLVLAALGISTAAAGTAFARRNRARVKKV